MSTVEQKFSTPPGTVGCGFICSTIDHSVQNKIYKNGSSEVYMTDEHTIEFISFKIRVPLYNGNNLTDSSGWVFRIEKTSDIIENIETYCLSKKSVTINFSPDNGENLDAVLAENDDWILHIGTEDGETLHSRADNNDWFPPRLKNIFNDRQSIKEMK